MQLVYACRTILQQLTDLVTQLHPEDFCRPAESLSGASVGQHLRHTLEFFICLEAGYARGVVNYDQRAHDKTLEVDKQAALAALQRIQHFVEHILIQERTLNLEVGYSASDDDVVRVETNTMRELVYNIEHAVHHMAIIKIGLREVAPDVALPHGFGVASSTLRYHQAAAGVSA